jgi:hypothetical protein
MPLNKDVLGAALYNSVQDFNNKDFENIEQARIDFWKAVAGAIIDHLKANATLNVPGAGLAAPNGAVTGTSITGTIL